MSLAEDLASRVAELRARGLGRNAIARELGCHESTVTRAARIAGVSFDVTKTAQAVETVEVNALQRRQEYVDRLYRLGGYTAARVAQALADDKLDGRALVTLLGVVSDKIARLEPEIDTKTSEMEQTKQALDELIEAIISTPIDEDAAAVAALAPGATMTSVLGPDHAPDQE